MVHTIRIAIDVMGGDSGPRVTIPAALRALKDIPSLHLILVGDLSLIENTLRTAGIVMPVAGIDVLHAADVIGMDEKPAAALRHKTGSSLYCAINLVAEGKADACVSAGNTGALMAIGWKLLGTFNGIERPAICAPLPAQHGCTYLLDVGANMDCTPQQLVQFAIMGAELARIAQQKSQPRVALLNVGTEAVKGNQQVQEAAVLLQQCTQFTYQGFVEADGLFSGNTDVVVCDGFAGNVALKSVEGTARFIGSKLNAVLRQGWLSRIAAVCMLPVLQQLRADLDPQRYNGASLLGLNGTVVKSHGSADVAGFYMAICQAVREVQAQLPQHIRQSIEQVK